MIHTVDVNVDVGTEFVRIRKNGRRALIVAAILGRDLDSEGRVTRIWLDRLVHACNEHWTGEWQAHGAISTILTRTSRASV